MTTTMTMNTRAAEAYNVYNDSHYNDYHYNDYPYNHYKDYNDYRYKATKL